MARTTHKTGGIGGTKAEPARRHCGYGIENPIPPSRSIDRRAFRALNEQADSSADPQAPLPEEWWLAGPSRNLNPTPRMTDKPQSAPSAIPPTSKRREISAESIGFTLKTDEKTLIEIDQIHEEAIEAAQAIKKFALR
jgi:hypothetical protein